jgi:hypothetical protein
MHLLVDAAARRPNLPQVTAQNDRAAAIALTGDLLADAHGRQVGMLGQEFLDPTDVRIQQAFPPRRCGRRRLLLVQGGRHGMA